MLNEVFDSSQNQTNDRAHQQDKLDKFRARRLAHNQFALELSAKQVSLKLLRFGDGVVGDSNGNMSLRNAGCNSSTTRSFVLHLPINRRYQ